MTMRRHPCGALRVDQRRIAFESFREVTRRAEQEPDAARVPARRAGPTKVGRFAREQ